MPAACALRDFLTTGAQGFLTSSCAGPKPRGLIGSQQIDLSDTASPAVSVDNICKLVHMCASVIRAFVN